MSYLKRILVETGSEAGVGVSTDIEPGVKVSKPDTECLRSGFL